MIVRAVVVPGTALLVPGAAGRAQVLPGLRAASLAALRDLVAGLDDEGTVRVVAPGRVDRSGLLAPSLAAAGIADDRLGWPPAPGRGEPAGVAASVALLALRAAGWRRTVPVTEVAGGLDARGYRDLGRGLRAPRVRVVVADDPRAAALGHVLVGLGDAGWGEVRATSHAGPAGDVYEVRTYHASG